MSNWVLEGLRVKGKYLGEFHISGHVELSRVAYGGKVKHTVVLDYPIEVYGAVRDRVILDHEAVQLVYSSLDDYLSY